MRRARSDRWEWRKGGRIGRRGRELEGGGRDRRMSRGGGSRVEGGEERIENLLKSAVHAQRGSAGYRREEQGTNEGNVPGSESMGAI